MRFFGTSAFVICFVASGASACGQASEAAQRAYNLLHAGQFPQAEAEARAALTAAPKDCTLHTLLALAYRGEQQPGRAYASFRTAVALCPDSLPALAGAAEIAYAQHLPEARPMLEKIVALDASNTTAHAMLGALDAAAGDCDGAIRHDAAAGRLIDGNPAASRQYAACLLVTGHAEDAASRLRSLLSREDTPATRLLLARAQHAAADNTAALETLRPLLDPASPSIPSQPDAPLLLAARIAEAGNHTPEAVAWLRQAISLAPRHRENYLYFAEISFNHGSYPVGIDILNTGLQQLPGDPRLLLARGVLEVQLGRSAPAVADFEAAHHADPKLSVAEDALGVLFSQNHDNAAARAFFESNSRLYPHDPLLQYLYAETLSQEQTSPADTTAAIAAARRAIGLEPAYQPARDLLCTLLLRQGDLPGVEEAAHQALQQDPDDETALYQLMLAERRLKHPDGVATLSSRLADAKRKHQLPVTRYMLQEPGEASPLAQR